MDSRSWDRPHRVGSEFSLNFNLIYSLRPDLFHVSSGKLLLIHWISKKFIFIQFSVDSSEAPNGGIHFEVKNWEFFFSVLNRRKFTSCARRAVW